MLTRERVQLLGILVCLLLAIIPAAALGQTAIQLTPSSVNQFTSEWNLQITGTNLAGNVATRVLFQNQSDTFEIDALSASSSQVIVQVPADVTFNPGTWSITVEAISSTGTTLIGPATLTVVGIISQIPPLINTPEVVMAEATSPSGANVTWSVSALSFADPSNPPPVSCTPSSGSLFALGTTTVTCSATDAYGTSTALFLCVVTDTTPPVVTVPADITVSSPDGSAQVVTFTATATDNLDTSVTPTCQPASGSAFPLGTTKVLCTAIDHHANYGYGTFTVTVLSAGLPVITVPPDFIEEATGPAGAVVDYTVTVDPPDATLVCTPASGSTFAFGTTTVNCTASNQNGSSSASFSVTVQDTTPPVIAVPPAITAEATGPNGAQVTYTVTATDLVDGSVPVTCTPPSGSTFALDTTTAVQCTATDSHNNTALQILDVSVVDTTPPSLQLPQNITAEATGPNGAAVTFTVQATDLVDGTVSFTCSATSGATFPLGTTTVNCSATDAHQNTATGSFTISVVDTTPPTLFLPSPITVSADSNCSAVVTYTASATDIVDLTDPVVCSPASGSTFTLGATTVNCSSTDAHGNTATGSFTVTVNDTTAPTIVSITTDPRSILWPPNHKMIPITVTVVATDNCDTAPTSKIIGVTSDQPIDGTGDGDTAPDWNITGPLTVELRAERSYSVDRHYTLTIATTDFSGNTTTGTVVVVVEVMPASTSYNPQQPQQQDPHRGRAVNHP